MIQDAVNEYLEAAHGAEWLDSLPEDEYKLEVEKVIGSYTSDGKSDELYEMTVSQYDEWKKTTLADLENNS